MADDMQEAEALIAEKQRWGLTLSDMALVRVVRLAKAARTRLLAAEERVTALEQNAAALDARVTSLENEPPTA